MNLASIQRWIANPINMKKSFSLIGKYSSRFRQNSSSSSDGTSQIKAKVYEFRAKIYTN